MSPLKIIQLSTIILLLSITGTAEAQSKKASTSTSGIDTANLVVRICQGDMPGQKKQLGVDYFPVVCAYTYNEGKLVIYKVTGFDLVAKLPNEEVDVASGKGNQLTGKMQSMIIKADTKLSNLYFDNVELQDKNNHAVKLVGLRPLSVQ